MRVVIVESPYASSGVLERGTEHAEHCNVHEARREGRDEVCESDCVIERNIEYARACVRDCLMRGEAPFASHLLYTQPGILRDEVPEERALGIAAGLEVGSFADATVAYLDRGISRGMVQGIDNAIAAGRPVERRYLGGEWSR